MNFRMDQSIPSYKDILVGKKEEWEDDKLTTFKFEITQFNIKYIYGKLNVEISGVDISPCYLDLFIPMNDYGKEIENKIENWINCVWAKYCYFNDLSIEKEKLKMPIRKRMDKMNGKFFDNEPKRFCVRFKDEESFENFSKGDIITFLKLKLIAFYKYPYTEIYSPVIVIDEIKTHKHKIYTFE